MVTVAITSDSRYPIDKDKIRTQVERTLAELRVTGDVEVSVTVIGDRKMRALNKQYRHYDDTTDVLSFPLEENLTDISQDASFVKYPDTILRLGDIVISYPQAIVNAHEYNRMVDDEINALIEHSILHLMGIHHDGD